MGGAILQGIVSGYAVEVCEQDRLRAKTVRRRWKVPVRSLPDLLETNYWILLGVKPQGMEAVLAAMRSRVTSRHRLISIAAGISTDFIQQRLDRRVAVVRVMPNLPVQVGQGMSVLCAGAFASQADVRAVRAIFKRLGQTLVMEERWMDAVTAVSGSGPAYVFLFVEAFLEAARALGLDEDAARTLTRATVKGAVELLERGREDAAVWRRRVTSPGGTTEAALAVFEREKGLFREVFKRAIKAAARRSSELAR